MIDSSSKIPTGIFSGNVVDLGNFDECIEIEDKTDNVIGKFCALSFTIVIPPDLLSTYKVIYIKYNNHI